MLKGEIFIKAWFDKFKKLFGIRPKPNFQNKKTDDGQVLHHWLKDKLSKDERAQLLDNMVLSTQLTDNLDKIKSLLGNSYDLQIKKFTIGEQKIQAAVVYLSCLDDSTAIEKVVSDLTSELYKAGLSPKTPLEAYEIASNRMLSNEDTFEISDLTGIFDNILRGESAVFIHGVDYAIICDTKKWEVRSIEEPEAERTIRGPREGFIESMRINTGLIRRKIRSPNLWIEKITVGRTAGSEVAFAYLKGVAQEGLVSEVRDRLSKIDVDGALSSGHIEEMIEDTPYTAFPLSHRTERVDTTSASILEGKIVILLEGTPFVLIVPTKFVEMLQAPDDYYEKFPIGTFIRAGRHLGFLFAIFFPGAYVAVINFHQELLPTGLMLQITAARQGVPFPAAVEVLMMEFLFELLREAGLRLPGMIGPTLGIVGALILGEAAIGAGLVSPAVVVVVALTAISSFIVPAYSLAIAGRIVRFVAVLFGSAFGLFGVQFVFLLLGIHLCSLRSMGYPYMAPVGPLIKSDLKDAILRVPWWLMKTRPKLEGGKDPVRIGQKTSSKPPQGLETSKDQDKKTQPQKDQEED